MQWMLKLSDHYGVEVVSSLEALKFTPRYTIEPMAGGQILQINKANFYYQFHPINKLGLGIKTGVGLSTHWTYYYSYTNIGWLDSDGWIIIGPFINITGYLSATIPTGNYIKFLGQGVYSFTSSIKMQKIYNKLNYEIGYTWLGRNPNLVDYGDRLFLKVEAYNQNYNVEISYNFPDKSDLFCLYDSRSLSINIRIALKTFKSCCSLSKLFFGQTIFGRDTQIISSLSAQLICNKKSVKGNN